MELKVELLGIVKGGVVDVVVIILDGIESLGSLNES